MELWNDRNHVWLRSRVHGAYLHADDDGVGVSLHGRRATLNAAWAVHVYHDNEGMYLLLHSAAYGSYLAATSRRAPRGSRGFRVTQRNYDRPGTQALMWQVVGAGFPGAFILRHVGGRYLRANGRYLAWNNAVTVEGVVDDVSTMMHWIVEPIPARNGIPAISNRPVREYFPEDLSVVLHLHAVSAMQRIRFQRARNDGHYTERGWSEFPFRGRSVYRLRNELARRLGLLDRFINIIMCVRAGRHGRLTPLVDNLPRHPHDFTTIEIVVFMSRTPAANRLRHPDVEWTESRERAEREYLQYPASGSGRPTLHVAPR
uniref:Uncharacterized protein n=1 Tax=Avena sativa TaxID=4498 RepID=A0ACD6AAM6_AVESA